MLQKVSRSHKKKLRMPPPERIFPTFEIYEDRPALTKQQMAIKASNEKWLNRKEPLNSRPMYMVQEKIERSRLYDDYNGVGGWLKKFNPMRG